MRKMRSFTGSCLQSFRNKKRASEEAPAQRLVAAAPAAAAVVVVAAAPAAKAVAAPAEEQDNQDDDPDTVVVAGIAEHVIFLSPLQKFVCLPFRGLNGVFPFGLHGASLPFMP